MGNKINTSEVKDFINEVSETTDIDEDYIIQEFFSFYNIITSNQYYNKLVNDLNFLSALKQELNNLNGRTIQNLLSNIILLHFSLRKLESNSFINNKNISNISNTNDNSNISNSDDNANSTYNHYNKDNKEYYYLLIFNIVKCCFEELVRSSNTISNGHINITDEIDTNISSITKLERCFIEFIDGYVKKIDSSSNLLELCNTSEVDSKDNNVKYISNIASSFPYNLSIYCLDLLLNDSNKRSIDRSNLINEYIINSNDINLYSRNDINADYHVIPKILNKCLFINNKMSNINIYFNISSSTAFEPFFFDMKKAYITDLLNIKTDYINSNNRILQSKDLIIFLFKNIISCTQDINDLVKYDFKSKSEYSRNLVLLLNLFNNLFIDSNYLHLIDYEDKVNENNTDKVFENDIDDSEYYYARKLIQSLNNSSNQSNNNNNINNSDIRIDNNICISQGDNKVLKLLRNYYIETNNTLTTLIQHNISFFINSILFSTKHITKLTNIYTNSFKLFLLISLNSDVNIKEAITTNSNIIINIITALESSIATAKKDIIREKSIKTRTEKKLSEISCYSLHLDLLILFKLLSSKNFYISIKYLCKDNNKNIGSVLEKLLHEIITIVNTNFLKENSNSSSDYDINSVYFYFGYASENWFIVCYYYSIISIINFVANIECLSNSKKLIENIVYSVSSVYGLLFELEMIGYNSKRDYIYNDTSNSEVKIRSNYETILSVLNLFLSLIEALIVSISKLNISEILSERYVSSTLELLNKIFNKISDYNNSNSNKSCFNEDNLKSTDKIDFSQGIDIDYLSLTNDTRRVLIKIMKFYNEEIEEAIENQINIVLDNTR